MQHLKITQNLGVRTIALNRPEKRNAFYPEMIRAVTQAFREASADKTVRAILLTGHGTSFCSGGDLEWMKSMSKYTEQQNLQDAEELFEMFASIRNTPVPVVGRIFGHAFGGGLGLISACDIVAAEEKTQFCFSEVKWGLVPAVISPFVCERARPNQLREWFLTARVFTAREAQTGGLIEFVGSSMAEVDAYLEKTFELLLAAGPEALRETKALHQDYSAIRWRDIKSKVTKLIAARRVSAEGQEGLAAFLEKRQPQWKESPYGAPAKI